SLDAANGDSQSSGVAHLLIGACLRLVGGGRRSVRSPGVREGSAPLSFHEESEGSPAGSQADRRAASNPFMQGPLPSVPQEDERRAGPGPGDLAVSPYTLRPSASIEDELPQPGLLVE